VALFKNNETSIQTKNKWIILYLLTIAIMPFIGLEDLLGCLDLLAWLCLNVVNCGSTTIGTLNLILRKFMENDLLYSVPLVTKNLQKSNR
jgi:hypothetical protein